MGLLKLSLITTGVEFTLNKGFLSTGLFLLKFAHQGFLLIEGTLIIEDFLFASRVPLGSLTRGSSTALPFPFRKLVPFGELVGFRSSMSDRLLSVRSLFKRSLKAFFFLFGKPTEFDS